MSIYLYSTENGVYGTTVESESSSFYMLINPKENIFISMDGDKFKYNGHHVQATPVTLNECVE